MVDIAPGYWEREGFKLPGCRSQDRAYQPYPPCKSYAVVHIRLKFKGSGDAEGDLYSPSDKEPGEPTGSVAPSGTD